MGLVGGQKGGGGGGGGERGEGVGEVELGEGYWTEEQERVACF